MYDVDKKIETESKKIDEQIQKLQEKKAQLKEKHEAKKQHRDLASKLGLLILKEFKGESFEYSTLQALLDKHLISDFDREFFKFEALAEDDPRRPKKRGRKKKED